MFAHRHRFDRVKIVLKVGDSYYELLQCECGHLRLEESRFRPDDFIEAYPHRVLEITDYRSGDALKIVKKELKMYKCDCGYLGDAHQMGIHMGNQHGLNLKFAISKGIVEETGEVVVKEMRG